MRPTAELSSWSVLVIVMQAGCFDLGFEVGPETTGDVSTSASGPGMTTSATTASGAGGATSSGGAGANGSGAGSGVCGDGRTDASEEECDDGDVENGDGCDANCTVTRCGNGIVTDDEGCDDGNLTGGDGCNNLCQKENEGPGGGGAGGGDGGAGPCGGVDLETDSLHCGACNFGCGDDPCVEGRCAQSLALGDLGYLKSVLVVGDMLYLEQKNGAEGTNPGTIRTVPLDFTAETAPGLSFPVANAVGGLVLGTVGARRVYFSGQSSKNVYACDVDGCDIVDLSASITVQINGMTALGATLYLIDVGNGHLVSVPIDGATGVPGTTATTLVGDYDAGVLADGVIELRHLGAPSRLFWSSYDYDDSSDGCIFRAEVSALPHLGPLPCFSEPFSAQGFAVAGDGAIYAQDVLFGPPRQEQVLRLEPDGASSQVFASNGTFPRGLDAEHLYAADATTFAIRAIPLDGGSDTGQTEPHQADPRPYGMDTTHADYVFYTVGHTLYRWPKPRR